MCIPAEGKVWSSHQCLLECPLCWIFLPAANRHALAVGETLEIGELGDLVDAYRAGCQFAELWIGVILDSGYGDRYPLESRLTAFVDEQARNLPADIRELSLHIAEPMSSGGVVRVLGPGVRETTYHGHTFTVGVFARKEDPLASLITQRAAEFKVDFDEGYETILGWLKECDESHEHCPKQIDGKLPTRVLDLSSIDGIDRVKLKVTSGEKGKYAALSYCWGTTKQLLLTKETLKSFTEDGIKIDGLGKTLRDAIHTARKLQIPYLWIDCLCIVQDSSEDIATEINIMSQIYKQAVLTINAATASDCDDGFLHPREEVLDRINATFRLTYPMYENEGTDTCEILSQPDLGAKSTLVYIAADRYCGYNVKRFREEPSSKRAWTLQESWLSPRMLIYGTGPLQWQCLSAAHTLGGSPPSNPVQEFVPSEGRLQFFQDWEAKIENDLVTKIEGLSVDAIEPPSMTEEQVSVEWFRPRKTEGLFAQWRAIVADYTSRAMTNPEDKLPALSGIAAEFQRLSGDNYLAGIWEKQLPFDLLWYQKPQPAWFGDPKWKSPSYRAPSWSWAAVDGAILFETPSRYLSTSDIEVHSASTTPTTSIAPLGKVADGAVVLSGPMRRLTWEEVQACFVICDLDRSANMYWDYIIPDNGLRNPYFKSPTSNEQYQYPQRDWRSLTSAELEDMDSPRPEILLPAGVEARDGEFVFVEIARGPQPTGLVLIYAGDGAYRRVAFFFLGRRALEESERYENINTPGERWWDWDEGLRVSEVEII